MMYLSFTPTSMQFMPISPKPPMGSTRSGGPRSGGGPAGWRCVRAWVVGGACSLHGARCVPAHVVRLWQIDRCHATAPPRHSRNSTSLAVGKRRTSRRRRCRRRVSTHTWEGAVLDDGVQR
jgi:hypothetical protein